MAIASWSFSDPSELSMLDIMSAPIWVFDVTLHRMWWANGEAVRFWRADSLEALVTRDFTTDSPSIRHRLRHIISHTAPGQFVQETWTLSPADHPTTAFLTLTPVRIGTPARDGLLIEVRALEQDQDAAEDRRLLEATRYTAVLISYMTPEGRLISLNPAAVRAYGGLPSIPGSRGDATENDLSFQSRFARPDIAEALLQQCRAGEEPSGEFQIRTRQAVRWHRINLYSARDALTAESIIIAVEEDITSLKESLHALERMNETLEEQVAHRTEALAEATRRAEQANVAKSDFLARMSHDLRTPLNAILGFSQILASEDLRALAARNYRSYGETILHAARNLLALVDDLLDLSRIEAGHYPLNAEPVNIGDIIRETVDLVQAAHATHPVDLLLPEDRTLTIETDRRALALILGNLLSNAMKFSPASSRIRVAAHIEPCGQAARIEIADHGPGIEPDELETIFEPYFRGRSMVARNTPGTGLGLPICKRLAEHLKIDFTLQSVVGTGTTAILTIPIRLRTPPGTVG